MICHPLCRRRDNQLPPAPPTTYVHSSQCHSSQREAEQGVRVDQSSSRPSLLEAQELNNQQAEMLASLQVPASLAHAPRTSTSGHKLAAAFPAEHRGRRSGSQSQQPAPNSAPVSQTNSMVRDVATCAHSAIQRCVTSERHTGCFSSPTSSALHTPLFPCLAD